MKITRRMLRKIVMEVVGKELMVETTGKITFAGEQINNPIGPVHNLSDEEEEKMRDMIDKVGRELERFDMLEFALVDIESQGFGFSFGFTRDSGVKSGVLNTVLKFLKQRIPEYEFSISSIGRARRALDHMLAVAGNEVIVVRSLD